MKKFILRLIYKPSDLIAAVNLNYTTSTVIAAITTMVLDYDKNLKVVKHCLSIYKYTQDEINELISILDTKINEVESQLKMRLSQTAHGAKAHKFFILRAIKNELVNLTKL